eukprot:gene19686-25605_t
MEEEDKNISLGLEQTKNASEDIQNESNEEISYFDNIDVNLSTDNINIIETNGNEDLLSDVDLSLSDIDSESDEPEINIYSKELRRLPTEWKSHYGRVVWAQANKQFPWWPAFVYDPELVDVKLLKPNLFGKKHVVYHYGSNDYGYAALNAIKDYEEYKLKYEKQSMSKKYISQFEDAKRLAELDLQKSVHERVLWNHEDINPNNKSETNKKKRKNSNVTKDSVNEDDIDNDDTKDKEATKSKPKKKAKIQQSNDNDLTSSTEEIPEKDDELDLDDDSDTSIDKPKKKLKKIVKVKDIKRKKQSNRDLLAQYVKDLRRIIEGESNDEEEVLHIFKKLFKLKSLTLNDFVETKSNELIIELRKHTNPDIANAAKALRKHWVEMVSENKLNHNKFKEDVKISNDSENKTKESKNNKVKSEIVKIPVHAVIRGSVPMPIKKNSNSSSDLLKSEANDPSVSIVEKNEISTSVIIQPVASFNNNNITSTTKTTKTLLRSTPTYLNAFGQKSTSKLTPVNPTDDFNTGK